MFATAANGYHSLRDVYPEAGVLSTGEETIVEDAEQRVYRNIEEQHAVKPVTRIDSMKMLGIVAVGGLLLFIIGAAK